MLLYYSELTSSLQMDISEMRWKVQYCDQILHALEGVETNDYGI